MPTSIQERGNEARYQRFFHLTAGRTAVIISHRLASARQCERIIVLDAGRIVADGSHVEILAKYGLYRRLAEERIGLTYQ